MAQATYTPILLYHSTTASAVPTSANLANGELALNISDMKLYAKNSGGAVTLLASNAASAPVLSFQTSLSGLTPSTATTGVVTLAGTLGVASGGTSLSTLTANNVILGNGTSAPLFVAPSTTGNVLTSNGTTWASSAPAAGGIVYTTVKTANYTAVANDGVLTNTTGGAFTVNLPATPSTGTQVFVADSAGTWATNNLTIGRNGSTIEGSGTDLVCDINGVNIQCVYNGTTWDIFAQVGANDTAVVTLNGTQTLTNKTLTAPTITSPTVTGTGTIAAATVTLSSTLSVTGVSTLTGGAVIEGLTVGRGSGNVATNTAFGYQAGLGITTSIGATLLGYKAGSTYTSGKPYNTMIGYQAGSLSTGYQSTFIGYNAGNNSTGISNTFVGPQNDSSGYGSGELITSGNYNTILGAFSGNSNGLDIRTASNYVVLSDGVGNPLISTANSQTVALKGAIPNSGTGITFPASQSASSDANTLDDYEEGTWSPSIGGSTTYTAQDGYYTKCGNVVTVTGRMQVNLLSGNANTYQITNLPFTSKNTSNGSKAGGGSVGYWSSTAINVISLQTYVELNTTNLVFQYLASASSSALTATIFGNSTDVYFTATYLT